MDDAAVVARLMRREPRLLVDDGQTRSRISLPEGHCGAEADDAAADQNDVRGVWHGLQDTTRQRRPLTFRDTMFMELRRCVEKPGRGACRALVQRRLGKEFRLAGSRTKIGRAHV